MRGQRVMSSITRLSAAVLAIGVFLCAAPSTYALDCVVVCKDHTTQQTSEATLLDCHNKCDAFCGGFESVQYCEYKGTPIKGNPDCEAVCKDQTTQQIPAADAAACRAACKAFCEPHDGAVSCWFKGETVAGGFDKNCAPGQSPPCDDTTDSVATFQILVDPCWRANMDGCLGYDAVTGIFTSPQLIDPATVIGRSTAHLGGDASDSGGTPVGKKGTVISDGDISIVPAKFGDEGAREVHTEIQELNLCAAGVVPPCVRAGHSGIFKVLLPSVGEVESQSATGDPANDFRANSFFNIFAEVELPPCGTVPFPGAALHNDDPLVIISNYVDNLPPAATYIHSNVVPVVFNTPDPKWEVGQRFGYLVLSGHGVGIDWQTFIEDPGLVTSDAPPEVECDGLESGGTGAIDAGCVPLGPRDYVYPVTDPVGSLTNVYIGTHDPALVNYTDICMPPGWTFEIEPNIKGLQDRNSKTAHGNTSLKPKNQCPFVIHFSGPAGLPCTVEGCFRFGFNNPHTSHDVEWQAVDGAGTWPANWQERVGEGVGPVHAPRPAPPPNALIIGNSNYSRTPECDDYADRPEVVGDIMNKQNALGNAGWNTIIAPNQEKAEMESHINKWITPPGGKWGYIVWYAGHGAPDGELVGVDCELLRPVDLVSHVKGDPTLVILDSCSSGAFATAANLIDSTIGFITATTGDECAPGDPTGQKSPFTACFVGGLNGLADGAGGGVVDGLITVAEAGAYAIASCANLDGGVHTPTYDGDHPDWVIGATKVEPSLPLCDEDGINRGCWAGCLPEECEADGCNVVDGREETNFLPVHLALVPASSKINRFPEAVTEILAKQKPAPNKVVKIKTIQDAINAIEADWNNKNRRQVDVVIFGYGKPGHINIGEDILENKTAEGQANKEKFVNALKGKIGELYLYGCSVGEGDQGEAFIEKLGKDMACNVHAWTGRVYALPNKYPNGDPVDPDLANKFYVEGVKEKTNIPAVTEWGMVVMALLVIAAGAVVIQRRRAMMT